MSCKANLLQAVAFSSGEQVGGQAGGQEEPDFLVQIFITAKGKLLTCNAIFCLCADRAFTHITYGNHMRLFMQLIFFSAGLHYVVVGAASHFESAALKNIRQVTFPSMGFEKAGESYFSPDGSMLIFQAVPTGKKHYQIYTIDLETSNVRLVSTGRGACTCPFFRPDGKKIIFASSHEAPESQLNAHNVPGYQRESKNYSWEFTPYMNIYEANPDGSDLKPLTSGPAYHAECAYSADGSRIVYASNVSGNMNIYTMKADGSDVQQMTHSTNSYNGGPFFSPDMRTIVYRADYEKRHYLQIYRIDVESLSVTQITDNRAVNWAPFWHPHGDVIVFTTSLHGHEQYELYLVNIKTGVFHRLTHNAGFNGLPSFDKNGTRITWTSKRGADKTCQLFIAEFSMPKEVMS